MKRVFGVFLLVVTTYMVLGQSSDRPKQPDPPGDISIEFGFNFLNQFPDIMEREFLPSRSFTAGYQYSFPINNYLTFDPFLGISNDRFGWKNDLNFIQDSARSYSFDSLDYLSLRKNLLTMTYLELAPEFRFYPLKTTNGDGLFVGVAGIAGWRIDAHTKIKYRLEGENRIDKQKASFGLNEFRFGYKVSVGWKPVNVYFKQYLTEIFNSGDLGQFPTTQFSIGLRLTGF
jgi:hypothetical protein